MAGQRKKKYKGEETGIQRSVARRVWSLRIPGGRLLSFWSEDLVEIKGLSSGWLLCFSDLLVEPQHLSLPFYSWCCSCLSVEFLYDKLK